MNIVELYKQVPMERHQEIVVSGDRLFFDSNEYVIDGHGELMLVRSQKELLRKVNEVRAKLGVK
jgi:hypothetical protein